MQGKFLSMYYKNGRPVFVYGVNGTVKEMEQFKAIQGVNYKEDPKSGLPLFWVSQVVNGIRRILQPVIDLTITGGENPRVVYDDTKQQFNLMNKINDNLAVEIAKVMAQQWAAPQQAGGVAISNPATAQAQATAPSVVTENAAVADLENNPAPVNQGSEELG